MPIPNVVNRVLTLVESVGGSCFLVGGSVVDIILQQEPKAWDIECYGVSMDALEEVLSEFNPNPVGKAFGIFKLDAKLTGGVDLDVSVPRRDNKTGKGHADFSVEPDPWMTPKEAARRRDFSFNSMSLDIRTGEIVDPVGGEADRGAGILRATDPETFVEDPLRALRAMQILARKAKVVDPATMTLIRRMVDLFPDLAKERVHEEWRKLLLKAERPSVGLEFLRESGWLVHFPELKALIGCDQNPEWHPEGDVWTHTLEVVDSAAWARDKVDPEWREAFVFGAMLHDVGKPSTTVFPHHVEAGHFPKERLWTARGHDVAGVEPAESFLRRMTNSKVLIERATRIVREHMQPFGLWDGGAKDAAWKRLHGKIRLDVIGWMCRCDHCGRPTRQIGNPDLDHKISEHCFARFDDLGAAPVQPILMGRDLLAEGFVPGPQFRVMLDRAFTAQLENESLGKAELLKIAIA